MNPFAKIASALGDKRKEITVETLAAAFDAAAKAFDDANEQYEVEIIIPEIRMKARIVDKKK